MSEKEFFDLEQRIIRLEENAWFQERKLQELEEHASELRQQLDVLEKLLEGLRQAFLHFQDEFQAARSGGNDIANPPPPHWGQERL